MRFTDGHMACKTCVDFMRLTQLNHVNQPKHETLYKTKTNMRVIQGPLINLYTSTLPWDVTDKSGYISI